MTRGLLSTLETTPLHRGTALVPLCGACGLYRGCQSPKMPRSGEGKRRVLVVGEAPGFDEDQQNRPFVGKTGQRLRRELYLLGVDFDKDCWVTNTLICRPPDNDTPTDKQIDWCRPNVLRAVAELKPDVILLLGAPAVRSVVGWLWRENPGGVERWAGWRVPVQKWNCWVCPTYHPSYVEREESPVLDLLFRAHLRDAFTLKGRPWKVVPDYGARCRVVFNPVKAADVVREMTASGLPVAFDYETDRLKPDHPDAKIVCCSLSDGEQSVAFLWQGGVVGAVKEFLLSSTPKIASNLKFEARWSLAKLGVEPVNWLWDTMLAAHLLDNRRDVGSIKFQAFALLGEPPWDAAVTPYLSPKGDDQKTFGDNAPNTVPKCNAEALLRYCAMDSLMEWLVAHKQMKQLGVKT